MQNIGKIADIPKTIASFTNDVLHQSGISNFIANTPLGNALGGVGLAVSAYSLARMTQSFYQNPTWGGAFGMGGSAAGVAMSANLLANASAFGPFGWAVAGGVIAGSLVFSGIRSMFNNGITAANMSTTILAGLGTVMAANFAIAALSVGMAAASAASAAAAAASAFAAAAAAGNAAGMAAAATAMANASAAGSAASMPGIIALLTNPIGWIILGGILAFAILWSIFHRKPPEVKAMEKLADVAEPTLWWGGPIALSLTGALLMLPGITADRSGNVPDMIVPQYTVNRLNQLSLPLSDGSPGSPSVYLEMSSGTIPARVTIVSPGGTDARGNPLFRLNSYTLSDELMKIVGPPKSPDQLYIPFFIKENGTGKWVKNPDVERALLKEDRILLSLMTGLLTTQESVSGITLAASLNKLGTSPGM